MEAQDQDTNHSTGPSPTGPSPRRRLIGALGLAAVLGGGAFLWNQQNIAAPAQEALEADPRNAGLDVNVRYAYWIQTDVLVFDVRKTDGVAPVDLMRALFQTADTLRSHDFERVELQHEGTLKFVLPGHDFKKVGEEYAAGQNPVFLLRTFPERLLRPDGSRPFPAMDGGLLAVAGEQMANLTEVASQWVGGG